LVPVIAMIFSNAIESNKWQKSVLLGIQKLIIGNIIAMDKLKTVKFFKRKK
jgi:hypothetical protein